MNRVAHRGPLARAPGALKRGHFRNCQYFVAVKGGTIWRKNEFSKRSLTVPKKTERGTLWDFPTSILSQNSNKMKGGPFGELFFPKKVSQCRKKLKGGTVWSRPVWYVTRENRKNLIDQIV